MVIIKRRFEIIRAYQNKNIKLPRRKTKFSAGYDLEAAETIVLPPWKMALIPTGLKVYMEPDEVLLLHIRSSVAYKKGLILANNTGIIDADYVDNPENEGHIQLAILNISENMAKIEKGDALVQGIFQKYLVTSDDISLGKRLGGFGSTGN